MDKNYKLPKFGIGPLYGLIVFGMTFAAVMLRGNEHFIGARMNSTAGAIWAIIGLGLIYLGCYLWVKAVLVEKLDDALKAGELRTTGVFSMVRNPIYSAIMLVCSGLLCVVGNLWFMLLPFFYWLLMTVMVKLTEEKTLRKMFGSQYEEYCKRVNRCIPYPTSR